MKYPLPSSTWRSASVRRSPQTSSFAWMEVWSCPVSLRCGEVLALSLPFPSPSQGWKEPLCAGCSSPAPGLCQEMVQQQWVKAWGFIGVIACRMLFVLAWVMLSRNDSVAAHPSSKIWLKRYIFLQCLMLADKMDIQKFICRLSFSRVLQMFSAKLYFPAFQHFHRRIKIISQAAPLKSLGHAGIQLVTSSAPLFMCLHQDLRYQCLPAPGRTSVLHGCLMQQRPGPIFLPWYKHLWDGNDPVHCKTARVLAGACKCAQSMCVVHNTRLWAKMHAWRWAL